MKTPESIVTSLEISKQLKEAGCKQESLFYWTGYVDVQDNEDRDMCVSYQREQLSSDCLSAYTSDELGEMLPECYLTQRRLNGEYECYQDFTRVTEGTKPLHKEYKENSIVFFERKESDARAKMWLYLKQNGLLEVDKTV